MDLGRLVLLGALRARLPKGLRRKPLPRRGRDCYRRVNSCYEPLEPRLVLSRDLLVADIASDAILRFDGQTGAPLGAFVTSGAGGLDAPHNPTFGPDGDLFVFSGPAGNQTQILRFDGQTGTPEGVFANAAGSQMAFGPDGHLYVATNTSQGVLRFDGQTGAPLGVAASGNGLRRAAGLDFAHDGSLLVLDQDGVVNTFADRILRFDTSGNFLDEFVSAGVIDDAALFTVGPDGHLYVPDVVAGGVLRFSGTTGQSLGAFVGSPDPQNSPIFQFEFGPDGNAYAATSTGVLQLEGETGERLGTFADGVAGSIAFFNQLPATDLAVTDVQIPVGVVQGNELSVKYTVTNNAAAATAVDEWVDVVYMSTDDVFDPFDQEVGRIGHTAGLAGGASYTETLAAPLPSAPLGEYQVFVFTDRRGEVNDSNRSNNVAISTNPLEVFPPLATSHDPENSIVVGRTLSAYTTADITDGTLSMTYSVYNLTDGYARNVLLTTTLSPGVSIVDASAQPNRKGQVLAWSLGTLAPYDRTSVSITVTLNAPMLLQLDDGPQAFASLDSVAISDDLGPAILRNDTIAPELLASSPDANTNDPFILAKAAELNQDPGKIVRFLTDEIGFESYVGSLRGARGTLWSGAGNSLDEASLGIALLRASGVPARYVEGILGDALAQQLILSMFPARFQFGGFVEGGTHLSDPANDPTLLTETRTHYWMQFDDGAGFRDIDTSFPNAAVGQTFTNAAGTFAEVPDNLRHKVTIRIDAEIWNQASTLFGFGGAPSPRTVLEHTFNTVGLVGRPLSIGHFVNQSSVGTIVFSSRTTTYAPYFQEGDLAFDSTNDHYIRGQDFQEVVTNFPIGSQILTGLFLHITSTGPNQPTIHEERALFDRIGFAARQGLANTSVSVSPDGRPTLSARDIWTVEVSSGLGSQIPFERLARQLLEGGAELRRVPPGTGLSAAESALAVQQQVNLTRQVITTFFGISDLMTGRQAEILGVNAYFARPRIVIASTSAADGTESNGMELSIDLRIDTIRAIAAPGTPANVLQAFHIARGIIENAAESTIVQQIRVANGNSERVVSAIEIFAAASEQNIPLAILTPEDPLSLDGLEISFEAKARISETLQQGLAVVVPQSQVRLAGIDTVGWYQIDPDTGETIGVTEDGGHQAITEYAIGLTLLVLAGAAFEFLFEQVVGPERLKMIKENLKDLLSGPRIVQTELTLIVATILFPALAILEAIIAAFLLGFFIDPSALGAVYGLSLQSVDSPNRVEVGAEIQPRSAPGSVSGQLDTHHVDVRGGLTATWNSDSTTALQARALSVPTGTVRASNGELIGTGSIDVSVQTPISLTVDGSSRFNASGIGSLSLYENARSTLGVSADWSEYSATINGMSTISLTTGSLTLNGQVLPAGTYSITTSNAIVEGSGRTISPTFSSNVELTTTDATVNVGPSDGVLSLAGEFVNASNGLALSMYSGVVLLAVDANVMQISLDGSTAHFLRVAGMPATLSADQNTPVRMDFDVQTSFADTYGVVAEAPEGWTVAVDDSSVTITPMPGLQGGSFPVRVIAQSKSNPSLVAERVVTVMLTPTAPGLELSVEPDPLFFVPFGGAEVPSSFRATIRNLGPVAETVQISSLDVPSSFRMVQSVDTVTIPAGETGFVGVYLEPVGQLPEPGTEISFTITATSAVDPAISETASEIFEVPAIRGVVVDIDPDSVNSTPGLPVHASIMLRSVGNVPVVATLASDSSPQLNVTGIEQQVDLAIGESRTIDAVLIVLDGTPLNSTLSASVTLSVEGVQPQRIRIPVRVAAPGADAIADASAAANSLGNTDLANRLNDLAIALTNLVQTPTSEVFKSQSVVSLDAVAGLLRVDPDLDAFVVPITAQRNTLAVATTPEEIQSAVQSLGEVLDEFGAAVVNLSRHNFELFLLPNTQTAQPQVPATYEVRVHNIGTQTTTYDVALSGLPDGVMGELSESSVELERDGFATIFVTLTQTSDEELLAFDFSVDVSVAGISPPLSKSAMGSLAARREFLSVIEVSTVPPFGDPGAVVQVSARLLNAVNRQQDALVSYSVRDAFGQQVASSEPVATALTVRTSLQTIELPPLDTAGLALGRYIVDVRVTDLEGAPIPGGTGQGSLLIGSPVTADLTVGPQLLPPGTSTVTNTLNISGDLPIGVGSLELVGMLPIEAFTGNFGQVDRIRGVTLSGNLAYVHGDALGVGSLHVVDISQRTDPQRTRAEIGIVSTSGVVEGSRLVAVDAGTNASGFSNVYYFDLAGGGTAEDPLLRDSVALPYIFGQDLVVDGNTAYVAEAQVLFNGPNILEQNGTILSLDLSDPDNLSLLDSLLAGNGTTNDGNPNMGGNFFMRAIAQAGANTLLVASSTSTGADTQNGIGRVLVVDVSNPAAINSDNPAMQNAIAAELEIPGTTLLADIEIVGDRAYVIGSVGGFKNGDANDRAPTGDLVVASLDVSDPRNPVLLHTETLARAARGALNLTVLGPEWLAITSLGEATDTPQLITIDVSDPDRFSINQLIDLSGAPQGMATDGSFVYVTQTDGLFIYEMTADDPLKLLGQQPVAGGRGVAARDDVAYVCGNNGISVVDYSDPENPSLERTVGAGRHIGCEIEGDLLLTLRGDQAPFVLDVYSLQNDPFTPQLLGSSPSINYRNLFSGLEATSTHAFVTQFQICFLLGSNDIFVHQGELFSIALNLDDPQNPTAAMPTLEGVLFNTFGDSTPGGPGDVSGCALNGGDHNVFGIALPEPQTALLAASSVVGTNTQAGVGQIQVVDVADPTNPSVVRNLDLPGTVHALGIGVDGNTGVVIGSTVGWNDPIDGLRDGNLTVTTLDVSDPRNPRILAHRTLERGSRTFWSNMGTLGNGLFAFSSLDVEGDNINGEILLIDATNPLNPLVIPTNTPLDATPPNSIVADGNLLLAVDANGLMIYEIGDIPGIPTTVQVQVPKGTGVEVVAGSFNVPPDQISSGAEFDTLVWNVTLTPASPSATFTWDSTITGLRPGESRPVTLDTTIDFAFQGSPGQLSLPPERVAAEQVLSLDPASQTARPGEAASYTVTIANPAQTNVTYDLTVMGVPAEWVAFQSQVTVTAGATSDLDLTLTSSPFASLGDFGFVVVATTGGVSGSVEGTLSLVGEPVFPEVDPQSHGVVLSVTPLQRTAGQGTAARYTARITNTGSATETFALSTQLLPPEFSIAFGQDTITVPPGASNFREVPLTIIPPPGTTPRPYVLGLRAVSTTEENVVDAATAILNVVASGVQVQLTPESADPGTTFDLMVTNTGTLMDTFQLAVAAPAALVATLGSSSVTLMPGESRIVPIDVGAIDFAFPGALELVGMATSMTNASIMDADRAQVMIRGAQGVRAALAPDMIELPAPGTTSLLLLVENIGNVEDAYSATIIGASGPISATLRDLTGAPVQTVPLFRLPGLSRGALLVNATLSDFGTGTITVLVSSLTDESITAEATATIRSTPEEVFLDFGDAPSAAQSGFAADYPTRLSNDGARHQVVPGGPFLGLFATDMPDPEDDGQPSADATGDDATGQADESPALFLGLGSLRAGQSSAFAFTYSSTAPESFVNLWIDWNQDGDWDDAGEQVLDDLVLAPGTRFVFDNVVDVPSHAAGGVTFARARISTQSGLGVRGVAQDGEVEDFSVRVTRPQGVSAIAGFSYVDVNNNGLFDGTETPLLGTKIILADAGGNVVAETFTNLNGAFRFDNLPSGSYVLQHVQPPLFIDGKDTPGSLGDADTVAEQFSILLPPSTEATDYLFGERGLLPWYIGKSSYLSSTPTNHWENLNVRITDLWHVFEPEGNEIQAAVEYAAAQGSVHVQVFDHRMQPLESLERAGDHALSWRVTPGERHYLRLSGTNNNVDLALTESGALETPPLAGDLDGNGRVDQADLDLVLLHWGQNEAELGTAWQRSRPPGRVGQHALDEVLLQWGN